MEQMSVDISQAVISQPLTKEEIKRLSELPINTDFYSSTSGLSEEEYNELFPGVKSTRILKHIYFRKTVTADSTPVVSQEKQSLSHCLLEYLKHNSIE